MSEVYTKTLAWAIAPPSSRMIGLSTPTAVPGRVRMLGVRRRRWDGMAMASRESRPVGRICAGAGSQGLDLRLKLNDNALEANIGSFDVLEALVDLGSPQLGTLVRRIRARGPRSRGVGAWDKVARRPCPPAAVAWRIVGAVAAHLLAPTWHWEDIVSTWRGFDSGACHLEQSLFFLTPARPLDAAMEKAQDTHDMPGTCVRRSTCVAWPRKTSPGRQSRERG